MTEIQRLKKNTFYTVLTISSRLLANVFLFWILARFYGPKPFGQFTFAHTLATTFIIFADFGLDILLTSELAATKEKRTLIFQKLFGIKLIFTFLAFLLMLIVSKFFSPSKEALILTSIFSCYLIFTSINNFFSGVFKGYEKFIYETRVALISNFILVFFTVIFIYLKLDIIAIAIAFAGTRILATILSLINIFKLDRTIVFKPDLSGLKEFRNKTLIFGFHMVFSYLFFQVDTLLLAKLKGDISVGIYQAVFKLIMLPLVIPDIFNFSLMPTLSRYFVENKNEWIKIGEGMGKILFVSILPISTILFFYAQPIIRLIYETNKFDASIEVLEVFAIIILVRFLLEPYALMLTTSNKQKVRLVTVLTATLLSIVINVLVIPKYDTYGAAIVSLIVNSFVGLVYFYHLRKDFSKWLLNFKNVFTLVGIFIFTFLLNNLLKINFILEIMILITVYSFIIYTFYLSDREKALVKMLLSNQRIKKYDV